MAERIRILRAIARLNVGGPALHVSYLSQGLEAYGYDTTLVAGELAEGEGSMDFAAEDLGVKVVRLPGLSREISLTGDIASTRRLIDEIRRVRPHIVHTHTAKAGTVGRLAAILARDARPPVLVHTFHGHVLRGYFGPVKNRVFLGIERALARRTTRLVAVGPQIRDELVELGVAPAEKFSVIRLGIDLEGRVLGAARREEMRAALGIPAERFVVGWIGRMTAIKRVPDILLTVARLVERGVDVCLCLVGDGPDRPEAERLAAELGIADRVIFIGYKRDVAPYYAAFDAFFLPSANEGTPVVAIEALAAGRPVVASRVGAVADVVDDGETGFLAAAGDVDGFAAHLEALAREPELRGRLSALGRERVLARYSVGRLVGDVDALYRELLVASEIPPPP